MGTLPRPDLPVGPHRDLVDALHDLHHRAGWPSLRALAREAGCSPTTVSAVFSSPRLPSWGVLEVLVDAMGGDVREFRGLWQRAGSRSGSSATTILIAGRVTELTTVRRHLEGGNGMLLVTGEAGIGKTRLVGTAVESTAAFVASGSCLPLSTEVPLLPIADALRAVHGADTGKWLQKALAECAPYVPVSLGLLVPELSQWEPPAPEPRDDWTRQRLFAAVETILRQLSAHRGLGVLIEDLHWADTDTLDLLEHLITRGPGVPIVGTWRLDDQATHQTNGEWLTRIRRMPAVATLPLAPLTRDETGQQLTLLAGQVPAAALTDSIYERTQGQPLFTEQLASTDTTRPLPSLLADLLDARLGDLTGPAWLVARALGVADRPLTGRLLGEITGLTDADLADVLHDLVERRLLTPASSDTATLRHPLLAEAIRRRLVAGEAQTQHMRVATALASSTDPEPAEIARHWQAAGDREQELVWRIRAAHVAHGRFALRQEADQWLRVLELWPDGAATAGRPPIRRYDALVSVLEKYSGIVYREQAPMLAAESLTLVPKLPPLEAAELLHRVGDYFHEAGDIDRALDVVHRALAIYEEATPSDGHVRALNELEKILRHAGRYQEAAAAITRAVQVAGELEDRSWYREELAKQAWYDVRAGETATAIARAREAFELDLGALPLLDAGLAGLYTDLLLLTGAGVESVVAAGERGLEAAQAWDLDLFVVRVTRYNMAEALLRAGHVQRAAALIEPHTQEDPTEDRWVLHVQRTRLDMLQGRTEAAMALVDKLRPLTVVGLDVRLENAERFASVELWTGRQQVTFEFLVPLIEEAAPTEVAQDLGPTLTLAARAAAGTNKSAAHLDRLSQLRESCAVDPFAIRPVPADSRAWAATWTAELSRLRGRQTVERWATAAAEWDKLTRPHDSAYCRWRGAQVALAVGQGTVGMRLLRRAARDAHEHVPLSAAIATTTTGHA